MFSSNIVLKKKNKLSNMPIFSRPNHAAMKFHDSSLCLDQSDGGGQTWADVAAQNSWSHKMDLRKNYVTKCTIVDKL